MNTYLEQATALLFPSSGCRALDTKFFFQSGTATVETLSRQVVACFAALADPTALVEDVDEGLTF